MFGVFCGQIPGDELLVTGEYAVITFHSDYSLQRRGFMLSLTFIPLGMYRKMLFDSNGKEQLLGNGYETWQSSLLYVFWGLTMPKTWQNTKGGYVCSHKLTNINIAIT